MRYLSYLYAYIIFLRINSKDDKTIQLAVAFPNGTMFSSYNNSNSFDNMES